jgi:hypothetical protein
MWKWCPTYHWKDFDKGYNFPSCLTSIRGLHAKLLVPKVMGCCSPNIGLATKAKGCKVTCQEGDLRVTSHALRSAKSVREWTLTLSSELPLWELEFQMDSRIFRAQSQRSKPIVLKSFYIIGKLLKHRCLNWAHIAHLDIWNTSYDKKKPGVKLAVWLPTTKSRESTRFPCMQVACDIPLEKAFHVGYNVFLDLIGIRGLHVKLSAPKVIKVLVMGILGVPRQKTIWMWPSWRE